MIYECLSTIATIVYTLEYFEENEHKYIKRGWGIGNGKNRGNRGGVKNGDPGA